MPVYECMFLLDTNKVAGDVPAAAGQLHAILERNHCEMLASRPWDERRLAYPVKGHKKGLYYLTYFRTDAKNLLNIGRDFALLEASLVLATLAQRWRLVCPSPEPVLPLGQFTLRPKGGMPMRAERH